MTLSDMIRASECVTDNPGRDFNFTMSVGVYGLPLKKSEYRGNASFEPVRALSSGSLPGPAGGGNRQEFLDLVTKAWVVEE